MCVLYCIVLCRSDLSKVSRPKQVDRTLSLRGLKSIRVVTTLLFINHSFKQTKETETGPHVNDPHPHFQVFQKYVDYSYVGYFSNLLSCEQRSRPIATVPSGLSVCLSVRLFKSEKYLGS